MTILGWMGDIADRVGDIAWPLTKYHRDAVEFFENMDESTIYADYHAMARKLMEHHAMARNDIYDGAMCITKLNELGELQDEEVLISREERDVRALLNLWAI